MSWNSPECLLADKPHTVRNLIKKAAFPFHAFGERQIGKPLPSGRVPILIVRSISGPFELQEDRGWKRGPLRPQHCFGAPNNCVTDIFWNTRSEERRIGKEG